MTPRTLLAPGALLLWACGGGTPVPGDECRAAWDRQAAQDFVAELERATAAERQVWVGYDLGNGAFVLHAGAPDSGGACVGLWQDGEAVVFATVAGEPKLLTPLYGYYFRDDGSGEPRPELVEQATQPPSMRAWLEGTGVERAVVMPVEVPDFPIEMPALVKVQLAIHEAFHMEVQMPRWHDGTGPWPAWDLQPDRPGLQACYTGSPAVEAAFGDERERLVSLVGALLDGDSAGACEAGREFFARRAARYELLRDVRVARHDGTPGTCREAEAIMELEEGTADFASWTVLYDLGEASREILMRRYRAQQNDVFYLTGAMQLHAVQLMAPGGMDAVARAIAESRGPEDGSLTSVLGRTLNSYCGR